MTGLTAQFIADEGTPSSWYIFGDAYDMGEQYIAIDLLQTNRHLKSVIDLEQDGLWYTAFAHSFTEFLAETFRCTRSNMSVSSFCKQHHYERWAKILCPFIAGAVEVPSVTTYYDEHERKILI